MTECERIVEQGFLPSSFFEEEIRCDYKVTHEMKKVWAIYLELYSVLKELCDKHGLLLFTDGGTTLGAIRHKGFIPWDDDMDVCLLRKDYNILKSLSNELPPPFFLQNAATDSEFGFSFMRICNSNTAYSVRPFTHALFNKGISIDIFPLDKVTEEDYLPRRKKIDELIKKNSAYMRRNLPNKNEHDVEYLRNYLDMNSNPIDIWNEIEEIATIDEEKETPYISLLVSTQYAPEKKIWPKHIFTDGISKPFENKEVVVPIGYDEQLKIYFGDYMKFPPVTERGKWHSAEFYPDIPYKDYYMNEYGLYK